MQSRRFILTSPMRYANSLLGLGSSIPIRQMSATIESKVFSNAVFMPELYPAKLRIPTANGSYAFTM